MTMSPALAVAFPLALDADGMTELLRSPVLAAEQLIEQLLFTAPGERLNQPSLGCGLRELLFAPLSAELQAATEFQVSTALQRSLGDVVKVISLTVTAADSELEITITYQLAPGGPQQTVTLRG
jgi:phage baseplate assembly protein W